MFARGSPSDCIFSGFECGDIAYLVQHVSGGTTEFDQLDLSTLTYSNLRSFSREYGGLGYSARDGFLYTVRRDDTSIVQLRNNNAVVKGVNLGTPQLLSNSAVSMPAPNSSGVVSADGRYFYTVRMDRLALLKVDLAATPLTYVEIGLPEEGMCGDIAFHPTENALYCRRLTGSQGADSDMLRIDADTGAFTKFDTDSIDAPELSVAGSDFFDGTGRLLVLEHDNVGVFFVDSSERWFARLGDANQEPNSVGNGTDVGACVPPGVEKSVEPYEAQAGDTVTFTYHLTAHHGLTGAQLVDTLGAGGNVAGTYVANSIEYSTDGSSWSTSVPVGVSVTPNAYGGTSNLELDLVMPVQGEVYVRVDVALDGGLADGDYENQATLNVDDVRYAGPFVSDDPATLDWRDATWLRIMNAAPEVCDDGVDNDLDGLIDQFDVDDCQDVVACFAQAPPPSFAIREQYGAGSHGTVTQPLVADLNGDDLPEIVVVGELYDNGVPTNRVVAGDGIYVYAGDNSTLPYKLWDGLVMNFSSLVVAELDGDSAGPELVLFGDSAQDIIVIGTDAPNHELARLSPSSSVLAFNQGNGGRRELLTLRVADLDADGRPEIIYMNEVMSYDPVSDSLAVAIEGSIAEPFGYSHEAIQSWASGAEPIDILSREDCEGSALCDGMELVAGSVVYAVDVAGGYRVVVRDLSEIDSNCPVGDDGGAAVADLDLDGDLDVAFVGANDVWIWDPVESQLIRRQTGWNPAGQPYHGTPVVGDAYIDSDGPSGEDLPDIIVSHQFRLAAMNAAREHWRLATTDSSGTTMVTLFDLDGNGVDEILYRDEQHLRIMYGGSAPLPAGVDANRNYASIACSAGTGLESPTLADVDNDGAAEVVTICGTSPTERGIGPVKVFESDSGLPWRPARPLWNTHHYHPTMISDNLGVPSVPQSRVALVDGEPLLNITNGQVGDDRLRGIVAPNVAAVDLSVAITSLTDDGTCDDNVNYTLNYSVENLGDADFPAGSSISFYDADPTAIGSNKIATITTTSVIAPGQLVNLSQGFIGQPNNIEVYVVVNDDGSGAPSMVPSADVPECDTATNNIANIASPCAQVCGNGTVEGIEACDAGSGAAGNGTTTCGCQSDCTWGTAATSCTDDGVFCNGAESCDGAGACVPAGAAPCASGESCDEGTDTCYECGDGVTEGPEVCDDAALNGTDCNCLSDCSGYPGMLTLCDDGAFCTDTDTCDGAGSCNAGGATCTAPNDYCDETNDTCLDCTDDMAGTAIDTGCVAGTPMCDETIPTAPVCVECLANGDCSSGVCDLVTNTCVGCVDDNSGATADTGCANPTSECDDTGAGVCLVCENDAAGAAIDGGCSALTPLCDETNPALPICVECITSADCSGAEVCDPTNNVCVECTGDSDCWRKRSLRRNKQYLYGLPGRHDGRRG